MHRVLILGVMTLFVAGAQAQVYKCVDASGKTTYLQSPCPSGAKSTAISRTVPPTPPPPPTPIGAADKADKAGKAGKAGKASEPKTAAELEQEYRKRKQDEEKAQEKEQQKLAEAKMREENCRNARVQITGLESGVRMRINEKGERYALDDAQYEQELASARKLADQWCK